MKPFVWPEKLSRLQFLLRFLAIIAVLTLIGVFIAFMFDLRKIDIADRQSLPFFAISLVPLIVLCFILDAYLARWRDLGLKGWNLAWPFLIGAIFNVLAALVPALSFVSNLVGLGILALTLLGPTNLLTKKVA